ncbi:MAG TPA: hypothetical protein DDW90_00180 [Cyanobacteria bacterium UBA9971]|nr:hypothetical protein [Cyanobacteria bacterium UBA9971]
MSEIRIQNINIVNPQKPVQKQKQEEVASEIQAQAPVVKPKSADEVLDFLSNSSVVAANKGSQTKGKKIEVSKHVNAEQASRISESVNKFFEGMEKHVGLAMKELNLTSTQAQNLTALQFNQKFDDEDFAIIASGERFIIK